MKESFSRRIKNYLWRKNPNEYDFVKKKLSSVLGVI